MPVPTASGLSASSSRKPPGDKADVLDGNNPSQDALRVLAAAKAAVRAGGIAVKAEPFASADARPCGHSIAPVGGSRTTGAANGGSCNAFRDADHGSVAARAVYSGEVEPQESPSASSPSASRAMKSPQAIAPKPDFGFSALPFVGAGRFIVVGTRRVPSLKLRLPAPRNGRAGFLARFVPGSVPLSPGDVSAGMDSASRRSVMGANHFDTSVPPFGRSDL